MFHELTNLYSQEIAAQPAGKIFDSPYPQTWLAIIKHRPIMKYHKDGVKLQGQVIDDPNYWRYDPEETASAGKLAIIRVH